MNNVGGTTLFAACRTAGSEFLAVFLDYSSGFLILAALKYEKKGKTTRKFCGTSLKLRLQKLTTPQELGNSK